MRTHFQASHRRASGFTLIELLVVAAIIALLLVLTVPAVMGMMRSSQLSQAENTIRASLMTARTIAMQRQQVAGLRFQPDGHIVQCYAANTGMGYANDYIEGAMFKDTSNYRLAMFYDMQAEEGIEPQLLPAAYRATMYKTGLAQTDPSEETYLETSQSDWVTLCASNANWLFGDQSLMFPVVLYSTRGRVLLGSAVFNQTDDTYANRPLSHKWYPYDSGDFAKLVNRQLVENPDKALGYTEASPTVPERKYVFLPLEAVTSLAAATAGPVVTSLKLFDYEQAKDNIDSSMLSNTSDARWGRLFRAISGTGPELVIDMQTSQITRVEPQGKAKHN